MQKQGQMLSENMWAQRRGFKRNERERKNEKQSTRERETDMDEWRVRWEIYY